jgi:hypothetical protein
VDRFTVDCGCLFPNKTAARTTCSNSVSFTVNTDTGLKANKHFHFFISIFKAKRLFYADDVCPMRDDVAVPV